MDSSQACPTRGFEQRRHVIDYVVSVVAAKVAPSATSVPARSTPAPALSVSSLVTDIRKLTARVSVVSAAYNSLSQSFSWDSPARAGSSLLIATLLISKPHLLLGVPALLFFALVLAPGYEWQFPVDKSLLPSRFEQFSGHEAGDSRRDSPGNSGKSLNPKKRSYSSGSSLSPTPRLTSRSASVCLNQSSAAITRASIDTMAASKECFPISTGDTEPRPTSKLEQDSVQVPDQPPRDVLRSVKEAQVSIASLVTKLDQFDQFCTQTSSFRDNRSYSITMLVLVSLVLVPQLVRLLPIRKLMVAGLWITVLAAHPIIAQETRDLPPLEIKKDALPHLVNRLSLQFEKQMPREPLCRTVEIFELQKQGLTPQQWETVLYSPEVWPASSFERLANKLPPGTSTLGDVIPPFHWEFVDGDVWQTDTDCASWVAQRGLEGDICDSYLVDGSSTDRWRRKRLIRTVRWSPGPGLGTSS